MPELTIKDLKLAILKALSGTSGGRAINKFNLLGRPHQSGDLEALLQVRFEPRHRALANQAFEELKAGGLISPTFSDLADPENWVTITDAGQHAMEKGLQDDLDAALSAINPNLLEIRRGAWAALMSSNPDSVRQAAHSARELIDQVLKDGAPDEAVKAQPGYQADPSSRSGVTRRMRLKFIMRQRHATPSESDLSIAEKAMDLVLALTDTLSGAAHARDLPLIADVRDALTTVEMALKRILL